MTYRFKRLNNNPFFSTFVVESSFSFDQSSLRNLFPDAMEQTNALEHIETPIGARQIAYVKTNLTIAGFKPMRHSCMPFLLTQCVDLELFLYFLEKYQFSENRNQI